MKTETVRSLNGDCYELTGNSDLFAIFQGPEADRPPFVLTCSVQIIGEYRDDIYNGTLSECAQYCEDHGYTDSDAQIALIEINGRRGTVQYTHTVFDVDGWEI